MVEYQQCLYDVTLCESASTYERACAKCPGVHLQIYMHPMKAQGQRSVTFYHCGDHSFSQCPCLICMLGNDHVFIHYAIVTVALPFGHCLICIYLLSAMTCVAFCLARKTSVKTCCFSHDGKLIAGAGVDGSIQLWNSAGPFVSYCSICTSLHSTTHTPTHTYSYTYVHRSLTFGCVQHSNHIDFKSCMLSRACILLQNVTAKY